MTKRKIIKIDEDKCTGCGLCIPNCAEGALKIVDGKARLVSDFLCDGLGACLGHCPEGAITIEEREAASFSEKAACPGSKALNFSHHGKSQLSNWPIQIKLVPVNAPYFNGADLLIAADCVPFAYPEFHEKLLSGRILMVGCPKLDDVGSYQEKIAEIIKGNDIKSVTCVRMEVPCCFGLVNAAKEAIEGSKKAVPFKEFVVGIKGEVLK